MARRGSGINKISLRQNDENNRIAGDKSEARGTGPHVQAVTGGGKGAAFLLCEARRPRSVCLLSQTDDYVRCPRHGSCWEIIHKYEYLIARDRNYSHAFKGFKALCDTCRFNHK